MIPLRLVLLLCFVAAPLAAQEVVQVPLVSLEGTNKARENMVPAAAWEKTLGDVAAGLEESVLTSLGQSPAPFKLKTVVVGLGLGAEVGVTGVLTLGAQARFRMLFCPRGQAVVAP